MCTKYKVRWAKGGLVCQVLNSEGVVERVKKAVQIETLSLEILCWLLL